GWRRPFACQLHDTDLQLGQDLADDLYRETTRRSRMSPSLTTTRSCSMPRPASSRSGSVAVAIATSCLSSASVSRPEAKAAMLSIAEHYDRLARAAQRRAGRRECSSFSAPTPLPLVPSGSHAHYHPLPPPPLLP